jgi:ABC-type Fe3+ transport system substrate-binding protein
VSGEIDFEAQYNNRALVPDHPAVMRRWRETAGAAPATCPPVEIAYGRITPNVMEGGGLVAGARNRAEAQLFLDFMASEAAARVLSNLVGATAVPGHGLVDLNSITLWQLRRPVDQAAFRRTFTERFQR